MTEATREEPVYFAHSATLRIHGQNLPLEDITQRMGLAPTHTHRAGERPRPSARSYVDDAWHLEASVDEERSLSDHLRELRRLVEPKAEYLRTLDARVDVICGYRSNCDLGGFTVEPDALAIFAALNVPLHVSIIIA